MAMLDINQALMRSSTIATGKRKLPSASKKVSSAAAATKNGVTVRVASKQVDTMVKEPAEEPKPLADGDARSASTSTTQAYIDLGQEGFGKHIMCRKCGLLYTAGEEQDEKDHSRFCKQRQRGITMTKWKNERLLKSFPTDDSRIIEIRRDDPPQHVKKMMEVKELLDDALGFVSDSTFLDRGVFLFIKAKQIIGCTTVERIETAIMHAQATDSCEERRVEAPAVVGICQIWVHPNFRGKRVATRLVDTIRERFIYGLQIAKHKVAFGQPTLDGLAFATAYVKPSPVLVYEAAFSPCVQ